MGKESKMNEYQVELSLPTRSGFILLTVYGHNEQEVEMLVREMFNLPLSINAKVLVVDVAY